MTNIDYVALLGFFGTLIAVLTPIMKLNSNLVKLNANFENMLENDKKRDERIEEQGQAIYNVVKDLRHAEKVIDIHELRLDKLEEKTKGDN